MNLIIATIDDIIFELNDKIEYSIFKFTDSVKGEHTIEIKIISPRTETTNVITLYRSSDKSKRDTVTKRIKSIIKAAVINDKRTAFIDINNIL